MTELFSRPRRDLTKCLRYTYLFPAGSHAHVVIWETLKLAPGPPCNTQLRIDFPMRMRLSLLTKKEIPDIFWPGCHATIYLLPERETV